MRYFHEPPFRIPLPRRRAARQCPGGYAGREPSAPAQRAAVASRRADPSDIDKHLDAVLRASGSALRYFSMPKTLDEMRDAMRAAMASGSWTPASYPPDADTTVMLALADGEVWQGYYDGEAWIEVSGLRLARGRVTYWQHTPKHPEDKS